MTVLDTLLRMGRPISSLVGRPFFILALVAGCASPGIRVPDVAQRTIELTATPFFAQDAYQCGPAALATVLTAAGANTSPDDLLAQVYIPARNGSLQAEMLAAARSNGAVPYVIDPDLAALIAEIGAGNPVLVLQNLGFDWLPRWHYAVAIGYDLDRREIILRSGRTARREMPLDLFDRTWAHGGRWAMVALKPQRVPAGASRDRYLQAVISFARVAAPESALIAYRVAANRWPESDIAWMGVGTSSYALQIWADAEQAFRRAASLAGDRAPALNNLALALDAQGRRGEALAAARAAVAAGGPFSTTAQSTLANLLENTDTKK